MRRTLTGLVAIAWISAASAQEAVTSANGLGPYHFGMTLAEAEATSQRAQWRVTNAPGGGQILSRGPSLQVGAARFAAEFLFGDRGLRLIALTGQSPSNCIRAVQTLLEGDLEPTFGAFGDAPGPHERGRLVGASLTASQSEIRDRIDEDGKHLVFSSRRGAMFIEVEGVPPTSADQGCRVYLSFTANSPYAAPLMASVTYHELDSAQSLVSPRWIARPSAQSFERYYPLIAVDAALEGRTVLDCLVNADGSLRCLVAEETPTGAGFGDAALHIAQDFRVLRDEAGASAVGKRVRVPITFRLSGGPRGSVIGVH
jgi:hypothetical protein